MHSIPQALEQAVAHHRAGELEEARRLYRQILDADPNQPDAWYLLGLIAGQFGRTVTAVNLVRQAIQRDPNQAHFYVSLGWFLRSLKKLDEAATCLRRALDLDPHHPDTHHLLGQVLLEQGKAVQATTSYQQALRLKPDWVEAQDGLRSALLGTGSVLEDEKLLNERRIANQLTHQDRWCWSHGAAGTDLGTGLLYYTLAYMLRAPFCVCIGSGGGFVPRLMRQAQRDLGIAGETWLIDANLPEASWGSPDWMADESFFRTQYPEVTIHLMRSTDAARTLFDRKRINYLHIDGDHTYEGCLADFKAFQGLLAPDALITIHDTSFHSTNSQCGVHRVVEELRRLPEVELVDLPFLAAGVAIVRVRGGRPLATPSTQEAVAG